MQFEPGIVDANVLVYALDSMAPQHLSSRALLDQAHNGLTTLYVTSQVLCELYAIVTSARRVLRPRSSAEAVAAIADLLSFLHVLPIPARTVEGWLDLLRRRPVTGASVFDLQIVSAMLANNIQRIYTFNTGDFKPFAEIETLTP